MSDWKHKDEWRRDGKGFCVTVTRHEEMKRPDRDEGNHRWCVYAYIYPTHPTFAAWSVDGTMSQPAARELPLHCGPSFFAVHRDNAGAVTSFQSGADYHHLYDQYYTHAATVRDAHNIFSDADTLFNHLAERSAASENDKPVSQAP